MPPIRLRNINKARLYEKEFVNEFRVNPNNDLYCLLCCQTVNCEKRFRVESHRDSAKHRKLLANAADAKKSKSQTFFPSLKKDFRGKLVKAFLSADIPLHKLQNPLICQLFTDLGQPVPSQSACRVQVDALAADNVLRVKELLHMKTVFLVVDESEVSGRKYLNVLVGDTAVPEKVYVVDCSVVESVNQAVVVTKIDDVLKKLDVQRNNFVLLLSDAASYMTACTNALKLLYPRLFHVTCMAHLLHNCAEKVRSHFADVDNLIARVKAATVKNKNRRQKFSEIGSPPQPVLTRWGTWLNAAEYYANNLQDVRDIVNSFDGEGILVTKAKAAVNDINVAESLVKIQRDYQELPKLIKKMESSKYTLQEAHADIAAVNLRQDCVDIGAYLKKRMLKNKDVEAIISLQKEGISPALYAELQCCQPTSASVERSFSMLGKLLRKDRPFSEVNVEKYLCVYYNKF